MLQTPFSACCQSFNYRLAKNTLFNFHHVTIGNFQGCIPMDLPRQVSGQATLATKEMDPVVQKLVTFLSQTPQVS